VLTKGVFGWLKTEVGSVEAPGAELEIDRLRNPEVLKWQRSEGMPMPPTITNGKICYLEIPATDIVRSAEFYRRVFGWRIRQRGDGHTAFDDTTGEVSGSWVLGRPPASDPGLLFYVMVDSVAETVDAIVANGGEIAQPIGADSPEITARFRDPAGNVIGLYQQRS
jgi:predicted enzyme related to lactoylglutathione lyase